MSTDHPSLFNRRLGAAVRARRVELGFSQMNLGDALEVTFQQVQKYERGINRLSVETLVRVAQFLKTTPQALIDVANAEDSATETHEQPQPDRLKLETVRRFSALSIDRQRAVCGVIKALAEEAA